MRSLFASHAGEAPALPGTTQAPLTREVSGLALSNCIAERKEWMALDNDSRVRKAQPGDVPAMVALSEQKRRQYQEYQPTFWRVAADAKEKQFPFFERLLGDERAIILVHEREGAVDGFVIAT